MPDYITIGRILGPHGLRGDVKILPLTYSIKRFLEIERVFLDMPGKMRLLHIQTVLFHGERVVLRFREITGREEASLLRGKEILIPVEESPPPAEGEYYHYQIIGLEVFTEEGTPVGKVTGIIETGGNDVYVVKPARDLARDKEILIPAISDVIEDIDLGEGKMVIKLMEGLLE